MRVCRSPWLIAAYHGLHRLRVPRHSPLAFVRLTTNSVIEARAFLSTSVDVFRRRFDDDSLPTIYTTSFVKQRVRYTVRHARRPFSRMREAPAAIQSKMREGCRGGDIRGLSARRTVRWPAYSSLRKGGDPAAGSPTATLLRLRPSHCARLGRLGPLRVPAPTSGAHSFHGVTGGVYKARERIHRGVADPRLLAIPASCSRVADCNPN